MTATVFVDTNVLVYARDNRDSLKQALAIRYLERLWQDRSGRTSIQVLSEFYVTVTRKLKPGLDPDDAWDTVQALLAWEPMPIDARLMTLAREVERRYRLSWWDSTIVASAQLQSCTWLLSEDLQDRMTFGTLTVLNPFRPAIHEADSPYANGPDITDTLHAGPTARPLHRPRGRPPRAERSIQRLSRGGKP